MKKNDNHISSVDLGDKSKPPIIFIHGNSNSKNVFSKQLNDENLKKNFRLIAFDLPGHGESFRDPEAENNTKIYSLEYQVEKIIKFIKSLKLKMDPLLVGHSLGGHFALRVAAQMKTSGLLTFQAPFIEVVEDMQKGFGQVQELSILFKKDVTDRDLEDLMNIFNLKTDREKMIEKFKLTDPFARHNLGITLGEASFKEKTLISGLQVPVAVFASVKDELINIDFIKETRIPNLWENEIHLFLESGHYPQVDEGPKFNKLLTRFAKLCFGG